MAGQEGLKYTCTGIFDCLCDICCESSDCWAEFVISLRKCQDCMQSRRNGQTVPLVHHIAVKNLLAGLKMVRSVISSGKVLENRWSLPVAFCWSLVDL